MVSFSPTGKQHKKPPDVMDVFCENIKTGVTVPIKLGKMLNIPVADIHAYDVKYYDGILVFSS